VSVTEARQAASHHDWVSAQLGWEEQARSLTALVSCNAFVDPAAAAVAHDITLIDPAVICEIASRSDRRLPRGGRGR
jgi:hypothetical protein